MSSGMHLMEALAVVRATRGKRDVVITAMAPARDWMAMSKGATGALDLVLVPSAMGQATSMGLGLALAQPDRRIIVCNGDGSMLMNLGSLVTIAEVAPRNPRFELRIWEIAGSGFAGPDSRGCEKARGGSRRQKLSA